MIGEMAFVETVAGVDPFGTALRFRGMSKGPSIL